jgi:hypothetical protein
MVWRQHETSSSLEETLLLKLDQRASHPSSGEGVVISAEGSGTTAAANLACAHFARNALTSSAVICLLWLPQEERSWLMMSAISASFN